MSVQVADNPGAQQYELTLDGERVGLIAYRLSHRQGIIAFMHTKIDDGHEGEGLGGKLVAAALDDVRERGLAVLPFCPFVRSYIEGHPEYLDLVPENHRAEFGL